MDKIYYCGQNEHVEPILPKNHKSYSLQELQEYVGGYIELIANLDGTKFLVINEDGKLNKLPVNHWATKEFKYLLEENDYLVGNVMEVDANNII